MDAVVHGPGEGERHAIGPSQLLIKATADDTGGTFFLSETTLAPGFAGPPPHRHERLCDMFYVLDGTLTMTLGDETRELAAAADSGPLTPDRMGAIAARHDFEPV